MCYLGSLASAARKHGDATASSCSNPPSDDAIATAYGTGVYCYREIAEHLQLHLATAGRIIRARTLQCEN